MSVDVVTRQEYVILLSRAEANVLHSAIDPNQFEKGSESRKVVDRIRKELKDALLGIK